MPKLIEIVASLEDLDEDDVIFVRDEWTPEAKSRLFRLDDGGHIPAEATDAGFKYFLEVAIALEVVEPMKAATALEKCERLIYYATHDA